MPVRDRKYENAVAFITGGLIVAAVVYPILHAVIMDMIQLYKHFFH